MVGFFLNDGTNEKDPSITEPAKLKTLNPKKKFSEDVPYTDPSLLVAENLRNWVAVKALILSYHNMDM